MQQADLREVGWMAMHAMQVDLKKLSREKLWPIYGTSSKITDEQREAFLKVASEYYKKHRK